MLKARSFSPTTLCCFNLYIKVPVEEFFMNPADDQGNNGRAHNKLLIFSWAYTSWVNEADI